MKKKLLFALILSVLALTLSGCMDYSEMMSGYVEDAAQQAELDAQATPIPALTAEKFTDAEAFLATYNEVKFSDTVQSLTERYGEPAVSQISANDYYEWIMQDGTGVAAVFFENGRLRAKAAHYDDIRQLTEIAKGTNLAIAPNISDDASYLTVCGLFGGRGVEILRSASNSSAAAEYTRLVVWLDGEGSCVQILFSQDDKVSNITVGEVGTDAGGEMP
ncbi:MAG: hypothetical protein ACOYI8_02365 [Christensenellales bacterium]|jgi:hypothetical protein